MLNAGASAKSPRNKQRRKSQLGLGKKLVETWIVREACDKGMLKVCLRTLHPARSLCVTLNRHAMPHYEILQHLETRSASTLEALLDVGAMPGCLCICRTQCHANDTGFHLHSQPHVAICNQCLMWSCPGLPVAFTVLSVRHAVIGMHRLRSGFMPISNAGALRQSSEKPNLLKGIQSIM